ncbi:UDP-N-acetylmuramate dehydrogenase [Patescibacteria group bacterium]|nr:UDP-N-acetylmuramate dehydrogenase [Patescibacteria group bacterium]
MKIENNYNLSKLNTFGINVNTKFFAMVESEKDLEELFNLPEFKNNKKIFLGGGSNMLFTKDFEGIVVLNKLKGIEIVKEDIENVLIRSMGGEFWQDLVAFTVDHGYWGIENLAAIPGTVGATPVQNIGAYGVELKDTLYDVEAFNIENGEKKIFSKEECELGYRESIFKNKLKGKYFISAVILKLSKKPARQLAGRGKKMYPALRDFLEKNKIEVKNSKDISNAVIAIRRSKLPDPKVLGNAGSFFKNVFVSREHLRVLQKNYSDLPYFEDNGEIKIPAGWLVEQCGPTDGISWKGYKSGNVGVYEKQSLVLVNYGKASGVEILDLVNKIIVSVREKFGLELMPEVNIV